VILAGIIFWGLPIANIFLSEINKLKDILAIIPVSLIRRLPSAASYMSRMLKENGNQI
jgi:hypothetical protein